MIGQRERSRTRWWAHNRVRERARIAAPEMLFLAMLAIWSFLLLGHLALRLHAGTLTGADSLFPGDQLQYMAWIRDSGSHFLAGNLFEIPPGQRVFVHPMWLLSAALWLAGLSIALSVLIWKPVAVTVLFLGTRAYVARTLPGDGWRRTGVVALAVFYVSPIVIFYSRPPGVAGETFSAAQLWGYLPGVIAVALTPVYLLAIERAVHPERPHLRGVLIIAAGTGLLISWLHPWQGVTVVLITIGLVAWNRGRRPVPLLLCVAATGLPLAGYLALAHFDASWRLANGAGRLQTDSVLTILAVLGPLLAAAIPGIGRPRGDVQEQALLLWPVAALLQYYVIAPPSSAGHALEGIAIPLSVLAARGVYRVGRKREPSMIGQRWTGRGQKLGRATMPALAFAGMVLALTVPGAIYETRKVVDATGDGRAGQIVNPPERAALRFLEVRPGSGGVLAAPPLGAEVPALTGKPTWVGHPLWTPDYLERARVASTLTAAKLAAPTARAQVQKSGARYILAGCGSPSLDKLLGPVVLDVRHFGCAAVYTVR